MSEFEATKLVYQRTDGGGLEVRLVKTDGGEDFSRSNTFSFSKGVKPKTLGITLAEPGLGNDGIQLGDW